MAETVSQASENAPVLPRLRPEWLEQSALVAASLPEPPFAQKYAGAQARDVDEAFAAALADEALENLAARGVNLLYLRFFSGFGLQFEKDEMERVRDTARRAHERGMKVAFVVALGAVTPEILITEEPESQNWLQVNADGRSPQVPIPVDATNGATRSATRVRPCYNSESYLRHIEKVCSLAIDFGADLVHFDLLGYNPEPDTCRCPTCVAAFRDFLREQYGMQTEATRTAGLDRFGHSTFVHVRPPLDTAHCRRAYDAPHQQEWIAFKTQTLTSCLARLAGGIHKRNPQCAVGADLFKSFGANTTALHGIDFSAQLPIVDVARLNSFAAVDDDHGHAAHAKHEDPDRRGRARRARASDGQMELFAESGSERAPRALQLVIAPDSNEPAPAAERGIDAGPLAALRALKVAQSFGVKFAGRGGRNESAIASNLLSAAPAQSVEALTKLNKRVTEELKGAQSLATIGIYQDAPSLAFDDCASHRAQAFAQQTLTELRAPFHLLFEKNLADLQYYACIVLPHCTCLSTTAAEKLSRFVSDGGGLVILEDAGTRDEWRRLRAQPSLSALLGPDYPRSTRCEIGKGRVAYIPSTSGADPAASLFEAVQYASSTPLPLNLHCVSRQLAVEFFRTAQSANVALILNAGCDAIRAVRCSVVCAAKPQSVTLLRGDGDDVPLEFTWDNRVLFTLEEISTAVAVKIVESAN